MPRRADLVAVAVCVAVISVASAAGVAGSTSVAIGVACAIGLTAAAAIFLDVFAGAVIGLAASAAVIVVRRTFGHWGHDEFWLALAQTLGLVAAGTVAGRTGHLLRRRPGEDQTRSLLPEPIFGSLGLLDADIALARIEEEIERADAHRRALSLVLLDVRTDDELPAEAARAARRAVSRIFESRLRPTDVPFALAEDRLGAILPETTPAGAWERIGAMLDAVNDAALGSRTEGTSQGLADVVHLEVGLADLRPGVSTADALLDAAAAALPPNTAPGPAP